MSRGREQRIGRLPCLKRGRGRRPRRQRRRQRRRRRLSPLPEDEHRETNAITRKCQEDDASQHPMNRLPFPYATHQCPGSSRQAPWPSRPVAARDYNPGSGRRQMGRARKLNDRAPGPRRRWSALLLYAAPRRHVPCAEVQRALPARRRRRSPTTTAVDPATSAAAAAAIQTVPAVRRCG